MTYRDDREAIHQRVQQLEQDLDRAQTEAAGRKEAQAEVERLRRVLARAQGELERLRTPKPTPDPAARKRKVVLFGAVAAALVLFAAGMAMFLLMARTAPEVTLPPQATSPAVPVPAVPPIRAAVPEQEPVPAEKPAVETEGDGLDRHAIQRVIRRNIGQVRRCYERELQDKPKLEGRVNVSFTIGPRGSVTASSIASSTLGDVRVESCILKAVRRWNFVMPKDGKPVIVNYPFVFRTTEQ